MVRKFPKCSVCGSIRHTKRKCPKLTAPLKVDDRTALTATVASQARTIEGLLEVVKVLGKPVVFETKGRIHSAQNFDDGAHRAVQKLLTAMHLYSGYLVESRGPSGCIMAAIEILEPATALSLLDDTDPGALLDDDTSAATAPEQPRSVPASGDSKGVNRG